MKPLLLSFGILTLSGCSVFGLGDDLALEGDLAVEARPPTLVLDNETNQTVYFVAFESGLGALLDLDPNVKEWSSLTAGETLSIPYESLDGYDEGDKTATVYWATGNGKGWKQESVRL